MRIVDLDPDGGRSIGMICSKKANAWFFCKRRLDVLYTRDKSNAQIVTLKAATRMLPPSESTTPPSTSQSSVCHRALALSMQALPSQRQCQSQQGTIGYPTDHLRVAPTAGLADHCWLLIIIGYSHKERQPKKTAQTSQPQPLRPTLLDCT